MDRPQECGQGIVGTLEIQRAGHRRIGAALLTKAQRILVAAPAAGATGILALAIVVAVAVLVP